MSLTDKRKAQLRHREADILRRHASVRLEASKILREYDTGVLEVEDGEKTYRIKQADILKQVDVGMRKKAFDFQLQGGPFRVDPSRNGRYLLVGSMGGMTSMIDRHNMEQVCMVKLGERINDVKILHNNSMFAVAQKRYIYIYDAESGGSEVHCLKDHRYPRRLEYLPHHYLLASVSELGILNYIDISMGQPIAKLNTRMGICDAMCQNPYNAVIHLGHTKGTVSLWTPNHKGPVMKLICHLGKVTSVSVWDNCMTTAANDGKFKVWDLRRAGSDPIGAYRIRGGTCESVDMSMTGMVSVCSGSHIEIWGNGVLHEGGVTAPYMTHELPGYKASCGRFCPFEDLLLYGSTKGFASMVVPGAGYAHVDSFAPGLNPFETAKQRREGEVKQLLEKLPADTICLNPNKIGLMRSATGVIQDSFFTEGDDKKKLKKKQRGKSKAGMRQVRKQKEQAKSQRSKAKERLVAEKKAKSGKNSSVS